MSTPKPTPEQLMQAVVAFARKQIAAGMSADKVLDLLVKKGLTPAAAAKVMAKLASPQAQGSPQATASAVGGKPVATHMQNAEVPTAHRGFGVQGRFLRLPANRGKCTLPSACVMCGTDHPVEPVVREEKKHSYGLSTGAAALWACGETLAVFSTLILPYVVAGLLILTLGIAASRIFRSRRNKLTLVYTACSADFATRVRRNTVANVIAIATGLLVVAGYTLMLSTFGDAKSSPFASRIGMAAVMGWPWFMLLNWLRLRFNGSLRIATNGKSHAFVDGCSAPFLETVGRLGVPKLAMPPFWSSSPRPGYPVASFWWTVILLGTGIVLVPVILAANNTAAAMRTIASIAHPAGSRSGKYHSLPGLKLWVPENWQLTAEEEQDPVRLTMYRIAPPDEALALEVTVFPKEVFTEFALDDANGLRIVADEIKPRVMSGYKATEPVATTLHGDSARQMEVSGLLQPEIKGLAAVPITFVLVQQKNDEYVYRAVLTLHQDWVRILGPQKISNILEWAKPIGTGGTGDSSALRE